jgi:hypothetical protein
MHFRYFCMVWTKISGGGVETWHPKPATGLSGEKQGLRASFY